MIIFNIIKGLINLTPLYPVSLLLEEINQKSTGGKWGTLIRL